MARRIAVTGAGVVSALGIGFDENCAAMREGKLGIGPLDFPDVDRLTVKIGAQVHGWAAESMFSASELTLYDRFTQMAIVAAQEAIESSGLEIDEALSFRAGVVLGNAGGGLHTVNDSYRRLFQDRKNRVHPFVVPRLMNNAAASHISMKWGLKGPGLTVSTACSSSNHAMGHAYHLIRAGGSDVMITGGTESMLVFGGIKGWEGLRVMSQDGCRPFCKTRNGMVQGEGAGIFVFEEWERARARGAPILCEIVGFGMTSDAEDIMVPSADGAARAMRGALADAKLPADAVGYINAHGTATAANDRTECAAIREVYGAHADALVISSTKSMHGHCIGGAGAVEMVAVLMALRDGVIAPTIGHREADSDCDLNVAPNVALERDVSVAASNAFAFGGLNAVLVAKRA